MEQIAIDMGALLETAFPELADQADRLRAGGLVTKMRAGGQVLFEALGKEAWVAAGESTSDSVRGWGAMAVAACPELSLDERLAHLRPFADDPHFAVREWAWLSFRPTVAAELGGAIGVLRRWTAETSPNLRRFASEATRPRGVVGSHPCPEAGAGPRPADPLPAPRRREPLRPRLGRQLAERRLEVAAAVGGRDLRELGRDWRPAHRADLPACDEDACPRS